MPFKEYGTPVEFKSFREVALTKFIFKDEVFGVHAYQAAPVLVDGPTALAFAGGDLNDLKLALEAAGLQVNYIKISWNETVSGPDYVITDLVVGVVVSAASYMNISGQRLLDALLTVGWYKNFVLKLVMPWRTYVLLTSVETEPFNRWIWDAKADFTSRNRDETPPIEETKAHFMTDGQVTLAIGEFIKTMIDEGYATTVLRYDVHVGYELIRPAFRVGPRWVPAIYRTHTRLSVDFTSDPECFLTESPFALTAGVIIAIGIAIGIIIGSVGVFYALQNLTTTERIDEVWGWVQHPETGVWEYRVIGIRTEKAPPEWWAETITLTIVGVVAALAAAAVVAVVVIPRILPERPALT
ncbi:hypothetical protein ES703_62094 [subsurface metagenome]